ncbi:hypothetical protein [Sphingosinicella sp. CPCC 101087]|uniref:hypothetical protein n=1 Tax=Sphingosinicella sp. CPCC 101087 TaxID=2497754 RepID=UPI00101C9B5D|nr:hypothetical protein [Sphingosinicella sp. CPCC 101087]
MLAEASAAVGSVKAAYDIAKGLHSLHTSTEVKQGIADILNELITARMAAMDAVERESALLQEIRALKEQMDQLKAWDGEKERYELKRYYPGTIAYTLKPSMASGEPPHHLCAQCYHSRNKGVLQPTGTSELGYQIHVCTSCDKRAVMSHEEMPATD